LCKIGIAPNKLANLKLTGDFIQTVIKSFCHSTEDSYNPSPVISRSVSVVEEEKKEQKKEDRKKN